MEDPYIPMAAIRELRALGLDRHQIEIVIDLIRDVWRGNKLLDECECECELLH
jgi:hypothetical protein